MKESNPYNKSRNRRRWINGQTQAYAAVQEAMRNGTLIRPEYCEMCNVRCKPHAHHENYEKPLEVKWLCAECHYRKVHKMKVTGEGYHPTTRRYRHGEILKHVYNPEDIDT